MASQEMINALSEEDSSAFDRALRYLKGFDAKDAMANVLGPHGLKAVSPIVGLVNSVRRNPVGAGTLAAETVGPQADIKGMVDSYGSAVQNFRQGNIGAGLLDAAYVPANAITLLTPGSASGMQRALKEAETRFPTSVPPERQGLLAQAIRQPIHGGELSKTNLPVAPEDMRFVRSDTGDLLPRNIITPETLQGSILRPAIGDRTAAGGLLHSINDNPLSSPVGLEGGPDFMRGPAQQADGAAWASNQGPITTLSEHAQVLGKEGKDINLVYTAGGGRNSDFATMTSDALVGQLPASKILVKDTKAFDSLMKKKIKGWPGLKSEGLAKFLRDGTGEARKYFVEAVASSKWQNAGFPDIASTRAAITEPGLLGVPSGTSGHAISRMDPTGRQIKDPSVPHATYPVQLGGEYVGGLEQGLPRDVMFPGFYAGRRKAGMPTQGDDRAFALTKDVSQNADQQWLDNIMKYLSRNPGGG
tara:strand:- start:208 stop:1629 length:1422 start_codon:yes stop_codon:yes gene_type:complete